jgi:hypothetical protein
VLASASTRNARPSSPISTVATGTLPGDFVRQVEFRENRLILRNETNNLITWEQVGK